MIPVQDLLHRIRWDADFGSAEFRIGYYDRIEHRIIVAPFQSLNFPYDTPFAFEMVDIDGNILSIPFHRICQIYRNGELIWERMMKDDSYPK